MVEDSPKSWVRIPPGPLLFFIFESHCTRKMPLRFQYNRRDLEWCNHGLVKYEKIGSPDWLVLSESLQKTVRKFVYDYFLENERAPVIEEIMEKFFLHRMKAHQILSGIEQAHNLSLVPGTQRIL